MKHSERLFGTRLFRVLLSLALALLLAGSSLFLIAQMSRQGLSGDSGEGPLETMPDLMVSGEDITFSDDSPFVGDVVEICAAVHNIGNATAQEIRVDFRDYFGGSYQEIGRKWIQQLPPDSQETVCVNWTAGPAGVHGILVKVDPENRIPEWNEENNAADRAIEVRPRDGLLPDLTFVEGIWFSNEHPKEGQTINICVVVKNIGEDGASNIDVRFADIYKGQTSLIGTKVINHLGPGESAEVCQEWKAQPAGEHNIFVKIDPENKIQESNEENNATDRGIVVDPPEQQEINLTLVRFDNDGNGRVDDVVIVVYDNEHRAIVGAEVFIDNEFYGRTPDSGTIMGYNFSEGWHVVKVHFNGHEVQGEFFSQG